MIVTGLVFVSTLSLRQHVLIDVIGGVLLAEGTWYISCHTDGWKAYRRLTGKLEGWIGKEWSKYGK